MTIADDDVYILHVAQCIRDVTAYSPDRATFLNNPMAQDATLRKLQILSESTQRLSDAVKSAHPHADWKGWSGFRNVLTHAYASLDLDEIWTIIEVDLPKLKQVIDTLLQQRGLTLPPTNPQT